MLQGMEISDTINTREPSKKYHIEIDNNKGRLESKLAQINIFTDGSLTSQGTGAGLVIMKGKNKVSYTESLKLNNEATVFQAEAIAIEVAARRMSVIHKPKDKYVRIFSDSQAVLKALDKQIVKSNTILNTKIALNELNEKVRSVTLHCIKAHRGQEGNELADAYAKQGAAKENVTRNAPITKHTITKIIEDKSNHFWENAWTNYKHCRQTKNFYPKPSKVLHKQTAKLSRSSLSTLIKIVTGQNNLNYLTNIIFPELSDQCRFCEEEEETFIHLLNECPVFYQHRLALLNGATVVGTVDWKPHLLVKFAQHPSIEEALRRRSNE